MTSSEKEGDYTGVTSDRRGIWKNVTNKISHGLPNWKSKLTEDSKSQEDSDGAAKKKLFVGMKNGYFVNENDTAYILVKKDRIIYNEYESKKDRKLYEKMHRTVISMNAQDCFINILPQTVIMCETFGDGCDFKYDYNNGTWTSGTVIPGNENINNQLWTRTNFELNKEAIYTLVIGDSGVGKSSLVKLLTNYGDIKTSDKANSCTIVTTFYALLEKNICFIDTRGLEDSDAKTDDSEILNDIQSKIHDFNGNLGKIVWIVHPASRKNKHLRSQLSFIKELGSSKIDCNIWDSLLMIVNKPDPMESLKDEIQGIDELAREYGCPENKWEVGKNLIGFTNLDWLPQDKRATQKKKDTREKKAKDSNDCDYHGNDYHYYYDKEIKSLVENVLNRFIKPFELLCLKYKCTKCGIIGNPQFVDRLRCHASILKYHPLNNIEYKHKKGENINKYHKGVLKYCHKESLVTRYHPGDIKRKHTSNAVLTRGGKAAIVGVAVTTGLLVAGATVGICILTVGLATPVVVGGETVVVSGMTGGALAAAGSGAGAAGVGGAGVIGGTTNWIGKVLTKWGYKNCGVFPCCGGDLNSEGCFEYYSCCMERRGARECRDLKEDGDEYYYSCCMEKEKSEGCVQKYDCCNDGKDSEGCAEKCIDCKQCSFKMRCCKIEGKVKDKNDKKQGCKEQCIKCHKPWGTPLLENDKYWDGKDRPNCEQGCTFDSKHDMKPIDEIQSTQK